MIVIMKSSFFFLFFFILFLFAHGKYRRNPNYFGPNPVIRSPTGIRRSLSSSGLAYHGGQVTPTPYVNPIYVTTGGRDYNVDQAISDIVGYYMTTNYGNIATQYIGFISGQLGYTSVVAPPPGSSSVPDSWLQSTMESLAQIYIPLFLIPSNSSVIFQNQACCNHEGCQLLGYHYFDANNSHPYMVVCYNHYTDFATTFSHEFVEMMTDSFVSAWYDVINGIGYEVADLCETLPAQPVVLNGNTYSLVQLWSDFDNGCVYTTSFVPDASTANYTLKYIPTMNFNGTIYPAPPASPPPSSPTPPPSTCTDTFFPFICGAERSSSMTSLGLILVLSFLVTLIQNSIFF